VSKARIAEDAPRDTVQRGDGVMRRHELLADEVEAVRVVDGDAVAALGHRIADFDDRAHATLPRHADVLAAKARLLFAVVRRPLHGGDALPADDAGARRSRLLPRGRGAVAERPDHPLDVAYELRVRVHEAHAPAWLDVAIAVDEPAQEVAARV
jgi:hypothetical protein